jgi:rRNA processing protein Krr1/Pno1
MTKDELQQYTVKRIFNEWRPDKVLKRLEKQSRKLKKKYFEE